jgi:hypothetical protein
VTPEVFARYRVGDDFNDCAPASSDRIQTEESKDVQPVTHHRKHTAQVRHKSRKHNAVAKHQRNHPSHRIAAR